MKKLLYSIIALAISSTFTVAQVRIGVTGGLQVASQQIKVQGITITGSNLVGFQAGLLLDAAVSENLSIRPQVLYSVKGGKYNIGGNSFTTTFNYIEVPIQAVYGFPLSSGRVALGAGPYVAYALNGKDKAGSVSQPVDFGSEEDQIKRIDYGLRLSAGYELSSGLGVTAYYAPGLANFVNTTQGTAKNSAFGLSLSYLFGGE